MSSDELHDVVSMAMARKTLRSLVPDVPPAPNEQLAAVLRDGLPAAHAAPTRSRALAARVASLGIAAKLLLVAGVAVAGVGGAATAVALSHDGGHGGDGVDSPRNHPAVATSSPTPSATETPTATTTRPATAAHHDGEQSSDTSGHDGARSASGDSRDSSGPDDSASPEATSTSDSSGPDSSGPDSSGPDTSGSGDVSSSDSGSGSGDTSSGSSGSSGSGSGSDG